MVGVEAVSAPLPDCLRARVLYDRIGGVGCCLHVVLSDMNTGDKSARFCLEWAREKGHADCIELAEIVVRMSGTQRGKLGKGGYRR